MSDLPVALYERDGDRLVPTALTIGPWDVRFQHGGPPSALLARALEQFGDSDAFIVARLTVEMIRPMPLVPMSVGVEPIRQGKLVEWLGATLYADGKEVALARAVRVRKEDIVLQSPNSLPNAAPPLEAPVFAFPFFSTEIAYHRSVEIRLVEGRWAEGPVTAWMRVCQPVVEGEDSSGLERLMVVADAANGLAPSLPVREYTFINPDLTVYLHRHPATDWIALKARSVPEAHGVGLVQATLFDEAGEIGRVAQSLLLRSRGGA